MMMMINECSDIATRKDVRECIKSKKCYPKYINMNVSEGDKCNDQPEWFDDDHKSYYMKLLKCIDPNTVQYDYVPLFIIVTS